MNKLFDTDFYDSLCSTIDSCVSEVGIKEIANNHRMLIIASNAKVLFKEHIMQIKKSNPQIELIIVVQKEMYQYVSEYISDNDKLIEWSGKYNIELIDLLQDKIDLTGIDSFLFFSKHLFDLRDDNIMEIIISLLSIVKIPIYNIIFSGEVYLFDEPAICYNGLKVYQAMESFTEEICNRQTLLIDGFYLGEEIK